MRAETKRAYDALKGDNYTLVLTNGGELITDTRRGIRPLLELYDSGRDLCGYSAADKVVGKAAAYLYALIGAKEVYAGVISGSALEVLEQHGISACYDTLVPAIRNRADTGFCPMETAVMNVDSPEEALCRIREKLAELEKKS